jgi:uncharacterized protein YbjT (DUF2867 family)
MITILGASGNTGAVAAELLLQKGERVRVVGRSAERLQRFVDRGAEAAIGDIGDAEFLATAFAGANAAYVLIPPDLQVSDYGAYQDRTGEAIVAALRQQPVRYVVFLSSVGATHADGTGPIKGLHRQEKRLQTLDNVNVLSLRAGYFFENHFASLEPIRHQGVNGGAIAGDVPIPMIATRDIGAAVAKALLEKDFSGFEVRELLGARDLSMNEVTRIIGEKIGKPDLEYVQFPYADFQQALLQMGLSESMAGLYAEMSQGINEGLVRAEEERHADNTTPTTFEQFADGLAAAYGQG